MKKLRLVKRSKAATVFGLLTIIYGKYGQASRSDSDGGEAVTDNEIAELLREINNFLFEEVDEAQ